MPFYVAVERYLASVIPSLNFNSGRIAALHREGSHALCMELWDPADSALCYLQAALCCWAVISCGRELRAALALLTSDPPALKAAFVEASV